MAGELCDFASNDYLGLSQDPLVIEAARSAAAECGAGSGGSALVVGRSPWHERLEERLARFEGQEAALLFPTGFAANVGTITALVERGDLVCSDRLNHASLIDGCRLSGADVYVYDRDRLDRLDARLLAAHDARRKLIVTDGVFSMDGVLAPLRELCELAARHGAMLLVDEAHGTGVFGRHGRGVCEQLEVEDKVAVRVGTLSKAIGSLGGFRDGEPPADRLGSGTGRGRRFFRRRHLPPPARRPARPSTLSRPNQNGARRSWPCRNSCDAESPRTANWRRSTAEPVRSCPFCATNPKSAVYFARTVGGMRFSRRADAASVGSARGRLACGSA